MISKFFDLKYCYWRYYNSIMSKKCEIKQKPFLTFEEQLAHLLKNRKLNVKKENSK